MRSFQSGNNNTAGAPDDFTRSRKVGLRLHQVLLRVKDVERSREFYTKKLGFKVLHDFSPEYVAVLTPNKLQIGLHPFRRDRARPWDGINPSGLSLKSTMLISGTDSSETKGYGSARNRRIPGRTGSAFR